MKRASFIFVFVSIFFCNSLSIANEFVIPKKTKTKKELAIKVKEDIADLYEIIMRQLGSNIQQSVVVQNQVIDKIKKLMDDTGQSTHQLKELRHKLENYLKNLEEQQLELQKFLLLFS